jgi:hypothetical protein
MISWRGDSLSTVLLSLVDILDWLLNIAVESLHFFISSELGYVDFSSLALITLEVLLWKRMGSRSSYLWLLYLSLLDRANTNHRSLCTLAFSRSLYAIIAVALCMRGTTNGRA